MLQLGRNWKTQLTCPSLPGLFVLSQLVNNATKTQCVRKPRVFDIKPLKSCNIKLRAIQETCPQIHVSDMKKTSKEKNPILPAKVASSSIKQRVLPSNGIKWNSKTSLKNSPSLLKEKSRTQSPVPVVVSSSLVSIDFTKMKVLHDPTKGIQSARFIPASRPISQTERISTKTIMPHVPILPDRISSRPVEVKSLGDYKILLCQSKRQCDEGIDVLRSTVQGAVTPHLGFDTESTRFRLGSQVSVIQLASSDICVIFQIGQIYRSTGVVPETLCKLLADSSILKTGVNATADAASLKKAYKLTCHGIVNIDTLAHRLGCQHLSLQELVDKFTIGVRLNKSWTKKQWSRTHLTPQEINYAANDAIASYRLFDVLVKLGKKC